MTNTKKKKARSIAKKTGVSYAGAINMMNKTKSEPEIRSDVNMHIDGINYIEQQHLDELWKDDSLKDQIVQKIEKSTNQNNNDFDYLISKALEELKNFSDHRNKKSNIENEINLIASKMQGWLKPKNFTNINDIDLHKIINFATNNKINNYKIENCKYAVLHLLEAKMHVDKHGSITTLLIANTSFAKRFELEKKLTKITQPEFVYENSYNVWGADLYLTDKIHENCVIAVDYNQFLEIEQILLNNKCNIDCDKELSMCISLTTNIKTNVNQNNYNEIGIDVLNTNGVIKLEVDDDALFENHFNEIFEIFEATRNDKDLKIINKGWNEKQQKQIAAMTKSFETAYDLFGLGLIDEQSIKQHAKDLYKQIKII